ncbi:MAG: hypothetical protein PHX77_05455 [Candidatus Bipolaricaulis sp.]|nr:hypothetical protein [Candidatus Bipolaricaulis sp.]
MKTEDVAALYRLLLEAYGPQGWWPADHPWEVCVGAILTQRVAWRNAQAAIKGLRRSKIRAPAALARAPEAAVAEAIRPALFYNSKAAKLKDLARVAVTRWGGDMTRLRDERADSLRATLLTIHGVGNETADAILVYVAHQPAFIADRYALRLFERLGWVSVGGPQTRTVGGNGRSVYALDSRARAHSTICARRLRRECGANPYDGRGANANGGRGANPYDGRGANANGGRGANANGGRGANANGGRCGKRGASGPGYEAVRAAVMAAWAADADAYGEMHALIVRHGKEHCRPKPSCPGCPLASLCSFPEHPGGAA